MVVNIKMTEKDDLKEIKEILLLNLKVNSFILTNLSKIKGFSFEFTQVLSLLKNVQEVLSKVEKNNEAINRENI